MADDAELSTSKLHAKPQRPRDAATLIIVRRNSTEPTVLLGRRHESHAFMPNKYVFPGGRLDPADSRMGFCAGLHAGTEQKLMARMRGRASASRARGLALAAIRETFEEVGLIIGRRAAYSGAAPSPDWRDFVTTGFLPDLSALQFVTRAITPPGRTRRFDTRFFIVDAECVANLDSPVHSGSGELLEAKWFSFPQALELELPGITRSVLERIQALLVRSQWPQPASEVPFQYLRHGKWCEDRL